MNDRPVTLFQNPTESPTDPRWVTDAGHGWLIVSLAAYPDALAAADAYCYVNADSVALEEDSAAGRWLDQHPEFTALRLTHLDYSATRYGNAPVRSWARHRPSS